VSHAAVRFSGWLAQSNRTDLPLGGRLGQFHRSHSIVAAPVYYTVPRGLCILLLSRARTGIEPATGAATVHPQVQYLSSTGPEFFRHRSQLIIRRQAQRKGHRQGRWKVPLLVRHSNPPPGPVLQGPPVRRNPSNARWLPAQSRLRARVADLHRAPSVGLYGVEIRSLTGKHAPSR